MTDKQARRLEKLLRLHAYQLNHIHRAVVSLTAFVAPEGSLTPELQQVSLDKLKEMDRIVSDYMSKLDAEVRQESKEEAEELVTLAGPISRFKN